MNIGLWIILIAMATFYGWIVSDSFKQFKDK